MKAYADIKVYNLQLNNRNHISFPLCCQGNPQLTSAPRPLKNEKG